jgi:hypothetical protein
MLRNFRGLSKIFWDRKTIGYFPAKAQRRQGYGKKRETFTNHFTLVSGLRGFAPWREILRNLVAALPRWALRGEKLFPLPLI